VLPGDIIRREFAFQPFGLESYIRHISFKDEASLRMYIKSKTPKHAYHSVAIYELPEAPSMEEKGWLGSDLLFDLDLDHPGLCGSQVIDDHCLVEGFKKAQLIAREYRRVLLLKDPCYYIGKLSVDEVRELVNSEPVYFKGINAWIKDVYDEYVEFINELRVGRISCKSIFPKR